MLPRNFLTGQEGFNSVFLEKEAEKGLFALSQGQNRF